MLINIFLGLVFASVSFAAHPLSRCEQVALSTQDLVNNILARRALGTSTKTLPSKIDHIRLETSGVPPTVQELAYQPGSVFRHYVKFSENRDAILQSSTLIAGKTPYVHMEDEHFREEFTDLQGVFFTDVAESPKRVGVFEQYYVDFQLLPGTPALIMEKGIYLIPGTPLELKVLVKIVK